MGAMNQYIALLLPFLLLVRPSQSLGDPISVGSKYLMSSEVTGDDYYLGCGDNQQCSMVAIANAEEHDGWTVAGTGSNPVQLLIRDGTWVLDVQGPSQSFGSASGESIFANSNINISSNTQGQLWVLSDWADGSYKLSNVGWSGGVLNVYKNVEPFVNSATGSGLQGQYWYFRSVEPQTTTTVVSTFTQTENQFARSTVTVTTTICPTNKRAHVNGTPLHKRQAGGAGLLDTTTQTSTNILRTTITETTSTSILTSTDVVTSCQPVTKVSVSAAVSTVVTISKQVITETPPSASTTTSPSSPAATNSGSPSSSSSGSPAGTNSGSPSSNSSGSPASGSPTSSPTPSGSKSSNTGAIVGGVIGGVIIFAIVAILITCLILRERRRTEFAEMMRSGNSPSNPPPSDGGEKEVRPAPVQTPEPPRLGRPGITEMAGTSGPIPEYYEPFEIP